MKEDILWKIWVWLSLKTHKSLQRATVKQIISLAYQQNNCV